MPHIPLEGVSFIAVVLTPVELSVVTEIQFQWVWGRA